MVLVLEKIGVRFTDFRKAEQLKPYILDWSPQNVLRIVGTLQDMSMENFLDSNDRESFRRFIVDNWFEFVYIQKNGIFFSNLLLFDIMTKLILTAFLLQLEK